MRNTRIYFTGNLKIGDKVALNPDASKHALKVLRLKIGEQITLFNGSDHEFCATITNDQKNIALLVIDSMCACLTESPLKIHLGQGISRGEKMDFTIQKSVELGVSAITPLFTEFCNVQLKGERLDKRLNHWQKIAQGASEQSGRCMVPKIEEAISLEKWIATADGLRIILDPEASVNFNQLNEKPEKISLLIGPEGGLSQKEIIQAKSCGFISVKLGPRILRTETASLATLSIIQARWGDV